MSSDKERPSKRKRGNDDDDSVSMEVDEFEQEHKDHILVHFVGVGSDRYPGGFRFFYRMKHDDFVLMSKMLDRSEDMGSVIYGPSSATKIEIHADDIRAYFTYKDSPKKYKKFFDFVTEELDDDFGSEQIMLELNV